MPNAIIAPLPSPLTMTDEEKQKAITEIQTKITEAEGKLAVAKSALERENIIKETVRILAEAGQKYPEEYMKSMGIPSGELTEEEKKAIYTKYGISELETKAFAVPTETFESVYKKAYEQAGLADVKTKQAAKQKEIDDLQAEYDDELSKINEDPWLSEGKRLGKARVLSDKYEMRLTRFENQLTRLTNEYNKGIEAAESVATRALSEVEKGRTRTKEELTYYAKRAEADIEAAKGLAKEEEEKELYRYFPEYVKKLAAGLATGKITYGSQLGLDKTMGARFDVDLEVEIKNVYSGAYGMTGGREMALKMLQAKYPGIADKISEVIYGSKKFRAAFPDGYEKDIKKEAKAVTPFDQLPAATQTFINQVNASIKIGDVEYDEAVDAFPEIAPYLKY